VVWTLWVLERFVPELCLLAVGVRVRVSGYSLFGLINASIFMEDQHMRGDLGSASIDF
jgi:hypothetical protein